MKTYVGVFIAILVGAIAAHGQGTIKFSNFDSASGLDAPYFEAGGVTKLSGSQFMAELLTGSNPVALTSLASTGFLTGVNAGYFDGGLQSVAGVSAGSQIFVEVLVWNTAHGSSFVDAMQSGLGNSIAISGVFSVTLGTPGSPAVLQGLKPDALSPIPEPSCSGILLIGALVWGFFRSQRRPVRPIPPNRLSTSFRTGRGLGRFRDAI